MQPLIFYSRPGGQREWHSPWETLRLTLRLVAAHEKAQLHCEIHGPAHLGSGTGAQVGWKKTCDVCDESQGLRRLISIELATKCGPRAHTRSLRSTTPAACGHPVSSPLSLLPTSSKTKSNTVKTVTQSSKRSEESGSTATQKCLCCCVFSFRDTLVFRLNHKNKSIGCHTHPCCSRQRSARGSEPWNKTSRQRYLGTIEKRESFLHAHSSTDPTTGHVEERSEH